MIIWCPFRSRDECLDTIRTVLLRSDENPWRQGSSHRTQFFSQSECPLWIYWGRRNGNIIEMKGRIEGEFVISQFGAQSAVILLGRLPGHPVKLGGPA